MGRVYESKHKQNVLSPVTGVNVGHKTLTLAVFAADKLIDSYTFRYAPQSINVSDLGLISAEPTGQGIYVENAGYWATQISISGHTGHKIQSIGDRFIDGESALQALRELMREVFGAETNADKQVLVSGKPYDRASLKLHLYNWIGEESSDKTNQEFYEVVPQGGTIFTYNRRAGSMLWNFQLNFIGKRIGDATVTVVKEDAFVDGLYFDNQFVNTWDYLINYVSVDSAKQTAAFTWWDKLSNAWAETYYQVAQHTLEIWQAANYAKAKATGALNIPYLIYNDVNNFIADILSDLGVQGNAYYASPGKATIDWDLLNDVRKSYREISRLVSYPEHFGIETFEPKDFVTHRAHENETLRSVASHYGVSWQDIAKRNKLVYPYMIPMGTLLVIPKPFTDSLTTTLRTSMYDDGITTASTEDRLYGVDIKTNQDGEWLLTRNEHDLQLTHGVDTVIQSLEARQKTQLGEFPDYPSYGNPVLEFKGQKLTTYDVGVLLIQLKRLILLDDRVSKVDEASLDFINGVLSLAVTFTLRDGAKTINTQVAI